MVVAGGVYYIYTAGKVQDSHAWEESNWGGGGNVDSDIGVCTVVQYPRHGMACISVML